MPVAALSLGYASHLIGDAGTKRGIALFYPKRNKWHLFPQSFRITTGAEIEELIFVIFSLLIISLLLQCLNLREILFDLTGWSDAPEHAKVEESVDPLFTKRFKRGVFRPPLCWAG